MLLKLVCPACRGELAYEGSRPPSCLACGKQYTCRDGVISFLNPSDSFNPTLFQDKQEQAWSKSARLRDRIRRSRFLTFLNWLRIQLSLSGRRDRLFYQGLCGARPGALILDVGCGGGRHYFSSHGKVIGIDPVFDLLRIAQTVYDEVYHASAFQLPFPDNSFDFVVSSDVIGHVPIELKDTMFSEIYRVLRAGGRTIHVIETDATNVWFRFAHRYAELFQKYFVEVPGHISLEMPTELRARFLRHGFKEVQFRKFASTIQECGTIAGYFNNEYRQKSTLIRLAVAVDKLLAQNLLVKEITNVLLEPAAKLADALTEFNAGSGALVVFEK